MAVMASSVGRNASEARKAVAWLNSLGFPHALLVNTLSELSDVVILSEVLFSLLGKSDDECERGDARVLNDTNGTKSHAGMASPPGSDTRARARLLEIVAHHSEYRPPCGIAQAAFFLGMRNSEMHETLLLELVTALQSLSCEGPNARARSQREPGVESSSYHSAWTSYAGTTDARRIRSVDDDDEVSEILEQQHGEGRGDGWRCDEQGNGHESAGRVRRLTLQFEQSIKASSLFVSTSPGQEKDLSRDGNIRDGGERGDEGDDFGTNFSSSLGPPSASSVRALYMLAKGGLRCSGSSDGDMSQDRQRRASVGSNDLRPSPSRRSSIVVAGTRTRRRSVASLSPSSLTNTPPRKDTTASSSRLSEVQERIVIWLLELGMLIPGARVHRKTARISSLPSTSRIVQAMRNGVFIGQLVNILESPPSAVRSVTTSNHVQLRVHPPLVRIIENPKSTAECRSNLRNALAYLQSSKSFTLHENLFDDCVRDVVDGKEDRIWALLMDLYETYSRRKDIPMRLSICEQLRGGGSVRHSLKASQVHDAANDGSSSPHASSADNDEWVARMNTAKRAAWKRRSSIRLTKTQSTETALPPVDCLNLLS